MDQDVRFSTGKVIDLLDLDLATLLGLHDRLLYCICSLAERNLRNGQCVLVNLLDLCPDLYLAAFPFAAVPGTISRATGKKVWVNLEIPSFQDIDGGIDEFIEVMRKNL